MGTHTRKHVQLFILHARLNPEESQCAWGWVPHVESDEDGSHGEKCFQKRPTTPTSTQNKPTTNSNDEVATSTSGDNEVTTSTSDDNDVITSTSGDTDVTTEAATSTSANNDATTNNNPNIDETAPTTTELSNANEVDPAQQESVHALTAGLLTVFTILSFF